MTDWLNRIRKKNEQSSGQLTKTVPHSNTIYQEIWSFRSAIYIIMHIVENIMVDMIKSTKSLKPSTKQTVCFCSSRIARSLAHAATAITTIKLLLQTMFFRLSSLCWLLYKTLSTLFPLAQYLCTIYSTYKWCIYIVLHQFILYTFANGIYLKSDALTKRKTSLF